MKVVPMYEPIEGESHCSWCKQFKPVSAFSRLRNAEGTYRPHSHCKACRNDRAKLRLLQGVRKDRPKPGRMGETSPGAWKWPRDERPEYERALDRALRAMNYPATAGQLTWRV